MRADRRFLQCLCMLAVGLSACACTDPPGPLDAGIDADEWWSRPPDAGADGGPRDAGPIDAEPTDALITDAMPIDAPPPPPCEVVAPTECPDPTLTFSDVEEIFVTRCAICHDGRGPEWPLTTYSHVVDWGPEIRSMVLACTMPPPDAGMYLPREEGQRILDWIRCGLRP